MIVYFDKEGAKMNTKPRFPLNEEEEQRKQELIKNLEEEIRNLSYQIHNAKYIKIKQKLLRRLKILVANLETIAPYTLISTGTLVLFSLLNITPFIRDNVKTPEYITKDIDNAGIIRYERSHSKHHSTNKIYYYSSWQKCATTYKRTVNIYDIKHIPTSTIEKIVSGQITATLSELLGDPTETLIEEKNIVPEEELSSPPTIRALIYSQDENNYVIVKEPVLVNNMTTILYLILTIVLSIVPAKIREINDYPTLKEKIDIINDNYVSTSIISARTKLELLEENYKRLTRSKK